MALSVVRFKSSDNSIQWGVLQGDTIFVLPVDATTTAELIQLGLGKLNEAFQHCTQYHKLNAVELLSPVTTPTQVLCQGANYRQHMLDSGIDPDSQTFNMFFTKSFASITGPQGSIIKPEHVQLLDYEIELTLVLGKSTVGEVTLTAENLHEYVAGICISNDISARDIQIPQMQFHKGKSYRTFCPLGPVLCLLDQHEMHYLNDFQLTLKVNGEIRQQDSTANLVFKPAETLSEYSQISNFNVGDVLLTGTPSGCALSIPSASLVKISSLLPEKIKWQLFHKAQARRRQYLKAGDIIESHIASTDGKIDLGFQKHTVLQAG